MRVGMLDSSAVEMDSDIDDLVAVSKAAEKAKVPAVTVVHMILGGFLDRVVLLSGRDGIGALRVDPEAARLHGTTCKQGLSPSAAFGALKIPRYVGRCLANRCPKSAQTKP